MIETPIPPPIEEYHVRWGAGPSNTSFTNNKFYASPTLHEFDNTSGTIWVEPEAAKPAEPWEVLEFGVIFAWLIVGAAFLGDYCWGKR